LCKIWKWNFPSWNCHAEYSMVRNCGKFFSSSYSYLFLRQFPLVRYAHSWELSSKQILVQWDRKFPAISYPLVVLLMKIGKFIRYKKLGRVIFGKINSRIQTLTLIIYLYLQLLKTQLLKTIWKSDRTSIILSAFRRQTRRTRVCCIAIYRLALLKKPMTSDQCHEINWQQTRVNQS
jgi:hypothetical protein